ncbi:MAG: DUF4097 domain-containing protein [Defluviitaleaceae bacterium]|nr:DUF4097 domain-containing protein [Defluviitaleaceae bacterium]
MHTEERYDNGPAPTTMGATPVHTEKKRSKGPIILAFVAGFLVAGLLLGAHMAVTTVSGVVRTATESTTVHQVYAPSLTPIRSSDVNNLRFSTVDVDIIEVSTTSGRINVAFHGEDFISAHCSSGATHSLDGGWLSLNSISGNFTILLPENSVDALRLNSISGRITVEGISRSNAVLTQNLDIRTTSGRINMENLAVPGVLYVSSVSGRINISNVLSDVDNTTLFTRTGRVNAD